MRWIASLSFIMVLGVCGVASAQGDPAPTEAQRATTLELFDTDKDGNLSDSEKTQAQSQCKAPKPAPKKGSKEVVDLALDRVRRLTDACTGLQGF